MHNLQYQYELPVSQYNFPHTQRDADKFKQVGSSKSSLEENALIPVS